MAEFEERPELPGSGGPPVEGRPWLWVKLAVWAGVLLALAGLAYVVAGQWRF